MTRDFVFRKYFRIIERNYPKFLQMDKNKEALSKNIQESYSDMISLINSQITYLNDTTSFIDRILRVISQIKYKSNNTKILEGLLDRIKKKIPPLLEIIQRELEYLNDKDFNNFER